MDKLLKHELLDRTYLIADIFENYIAQHDADRDANLNNRITSITEQLWQLYQEIGNIEDSK